VWRFGALAVVALAGTALLSGPAGFLLGTVTGSPATSRPAPCLPGDEVPIMASPHASPQQLRTVQYNSLPPTSGPHLGFTVATGIYREPLPEGLTVHAMEHGHVVIQYPPDPPRDLVRQLERLAKRYGNDVILAPYPPLDRGIALTAWGRIEVLDRWDEHRASEFIEQLRNRYDHGWTRATDCPG
jgi:hypothetical protein